MLCRATEGAEDTAAYIPSVSYKHLDVYKRQVFKAYFNCSVKEYMARRI